MRGRRRGAKGREGSRAKMGGVRFQPCGWAQFACPLCGAHRPGRGGPWAGTLQKEGERGGGGHNRTEGRLHALFTRYLPLYLLCLLTNRRQKKKKGQKSEFEAELGESGPVRGKDVLLMHCARTAKNVT